MSLLLLRLVDLLATLIYIALIGRVLLSWINVGSSGPFYTVAVILHQITEPILAPIRRILPSFGLLDLSPMIAIIVISLVRRILVSLVG